MRWLLFAPLFACSGPIATPTATQTTAPVAERHAACEVVAFVDGVERGCASAGMTVIDLADAWVPTLFAETPYKATYEQLALGNDADGKPLDGEDALQELYGVVPSLAIVRARLADDARHQCHDAIDRAPIAMLEKQVSQDDREQVALANAVRATLEKRMPTAIDPELWLRWAKLDAQYRGLVAAEQHFRCDGYLGAKDTDGQFTWRQGNAVEMFQRQNFLMPNERLDAETRDALALDSRELDFRLALRVLRERVADATGLIEDGTAGAGALPILGRMLDPVAMRGAHGHDQPLANAAPDLIGPATEAAARALGWKDPASAAAFLATHPGGLRVAISLPPRPAYHRTHMELSAEIDRGDVWYDEQPVPRVAWRRPAVILYAQDGSTRRALVRWPTTIGGWSDVRIDGALTKRWKESDVGPREWRQLYVAPTWLPPDTTPDAELVRWVGRGKWELKKTIMGPGPLSAFGMIRLPHERAVKTKTGVQYVDNGIGTHGSAVVTSLLNGTSHGCHRLYNHLAMRLGGFLLQHRDHVVRGEQPEHYRREIAVGGGFHARIDTRGFMFELTPPVHVDVLPGTIRSARKVPPANAAPAGAE